MSIIMVYKDISLKRYKEAFIKNNVARKTTFYYQNLYHTQKEI